MNSAKNKQRGATMIEYAILAALISVVAIAAITLVGGDVSNVFTNISNRITTAP